MRHDAKPSLSNSPWMRGAPQSIFSILIRRISARRPASMRGRPPRFRDFQRQYRRKPARCQRTSVCGRMIVMALRIAGNHTTSEAGLRGHLLAEGQEQTGSQSYVPPNLKHDKALKMALDLLHGRVANTSLP